ncbi:kinetochore-associated protein 1-like [Teleopsis dalmanni]|uniref:kinetochore-associated protein 1-like n=1 Tax=Teleopsis dalmanni TaxID=139649 RepID=UPI0018CD9EA9|nr:kinetochore-associated protein 1-like [Teleopsis dalmanni]XP_037940726.1 kinetochore-associated protein 1-like [Teleopsis dalmanni]
MFRSNNEQYCIVPKKTEILNSICDFLRHFTRLSDKFLLLYFYSKYKPYGVDHLEAIQVCYKFVLEHKDKLTEEKQIERVTDVVRKYAILKTEHILHVNGFTEKNFLSTANNPLNLISELYRSERILSKNLSKVISVANEIAKLHSINLEVIQCQLLEEWLSFGNYSEVYLDCVTIQLTDPQIPENVLVVFKHRAEENILKGKCILNTWNAIRAMQFLGTKIFPEYRNINSKFLLYIYKKLTVINELSVPTVYSSYMGNKFIYDLKQFIHNNMVERFPFVKKIMLLKMLLWQKLHNPKTLKYISTLCLSMGLHSAKLWNWLLMRMIDHNMITELNLLTEILSLKPELLNSKGLYAAWDYILEHPFKTAQQRYPIRQDKKLSDTVQRIKNCPIVKQLDLVKFLQHCIRLERPRIARILVKLCKIYEQKGVTTEMLKACKIL